jgi:hypothetical protein
LNEKFSNYIKERYKVVDYEVKKPSQRIIYLTWTPYGYTRRFRINRARMRCIISKGLYVIGARSAVQKRRVRVRGYNGHTNSTMVGIVKWRIQDDHHIG